MRFHMFLGILILTLLALLSSFFVDPAAGIDHRQGNFKVGLQCCLQSASYLFISVASQGERCDCPLVPNMDRTLPAPRAPVGCWASWGARGYGPWCAGPWSDRDGQLPGKEAAHPARHVPILAKELTALCLFPPGGGMMVGRNHMGRPRCAHARGSWPEPAGCWAGQLRKAEGWDTELEAPGQLVQYSGMQQGPGWAMVGLGHCETLQTECEVVCVGCGFQGLGGSSDNHDPPPPPKT